MTTEAQAVSTIESVPTKADMLDRIKLLSDEIDANEEENRMMEAEINQLYAQIDAMKT